MSADGHLRCKGTIREVTYLLERLYAYLIDKVKHPKICKDDYEYGVDFYKSKNDSSKCDLIKYYYDGPIWIFRIFRYTLSIHLYD